MKEGEPKMEGGIWYCMLLKTKKIRGLKIEWDNHGHCILVGELNSYRMVS